ncbi:MAG: rhodanese-like domain-containing protein [Thermoflavifilum aggregans]|nr:rhodanese-like domain-containing protein [Thermoflavifilum aggregans]
MNWFQKLFGRKTRKDFATWVQQGAIILDVRTPQEFQAGHISGARNIPVQQLSAHLHKLPKDRIIITCCASGMRSAMAKNILKQAGFKEVYNGGSWMSLSNKIK